MTVLDSVMAVLHLVFAGAWTGSVVFVAWGVLPKALDGDLGPDALDFVAGRLTWLSRTSAVVLFVSGGHLAGTRYTVESLTGSTRGYLVLAMLGLWLVLAALVEVGSSRLTEETSRGKVRSPARTARPVYLAAAAVAVLLLVDAGLLMGGV
jgi:putative copper export protein